MVSPFLMGGGYTAFLFIAAILEAEWRGENWRQIRR